MTKNNKGSIILIDVNFFQFELPVNVIYSTITGYITINRLCIKIVFQ